MANTAQLQQAMWTAMYRGTRVWDEACDEAIKRHVRHMERHPCAHTGDHLDTIPQCPDCFKQHLDMVYDHWG